METETTTIWNEALCGLPADRPAPAQKETRTPAMRVARYLLRNGSVAAGAKDLDIPVPLFERYVRMAIVALIGQAFAYRAPVPRDRLQSPFELDAQDLWREIQHGSLRAEPREELDATRGGE